MSRDKNTLGFFFWRHVCLDPLYNTLTGVILVCFDLCGHHATWMMMKYFFPSWASKERPFDDLDVVSGDGTVSLLKILNNNIPATYVWFSTYFVSGVFVIFCVCLEPRKL